MVTPKIKQMIIKDYEKLGELPSDCDLEDKYNEVLELIDEIINDKLEID